MIRNRFWADVAETWMLFLGGSWCHIHKECRITTNLNLECRDSLMIWCFQVLYDAAWQAILESPGGLDKLDGLATALAATGVVGAEPPHQHALNLEADHTQAGPANISATVCLSPQWPPAEFTGIVTPQSQPVPEPARLESSSLVRRSMEIFESDGPHLVRAARLMDLDVLYFQAMCAHPLLIEKVRGWAAACQGQFPGLRTRLGGGMLLFSSQMEGPSAAIRWARIKTVARSIEKVRRCYDQVNFIYANPA